MKEYLQFIKIRKFKKKIIPQRAIKTASKRIWNSSSPTNTRKIQLHMKQSSLKTNWKLVEGLGYNQGYKKDTHVVR